MNIELDPKEVVGSRTKSEPLHNLLSREDYFKGDGLKAVPVKKLSENVSVKKLDEFLKS